MTDERNDPPELALRRAFRGADPGPAPAGLRAAVDAIPGGHDRIRRPGLERFSMPAAALAAAAALIVLVWQGLGLPASPFGGGATPIATSVPFDPAIVGPGLAEPSSALGYWLLAGIVAGVLFLYGIGVHGWRRGVLLGGVVGVLGYATFCSFVPIDAGITGWGPGIAVEGAAMPPGSHEDLYYVTARPYQPFSFGIDLIGSGSVPVRIESVVTDIPVNRTEFVGMRWTAIWLDGEPNGGMTGPSTPFEPFDLPREGRAIWIIGRSSYCALGRAPTANEGGIGSTYLGDLRLNVTVLGWPRVIDIQDSTPIRLVEAYGPTCPNPTDVPPQPTSAP
jgi:hypothetical protein